MNPTCDKISCLFLPDELITEILSFLSVKYLMRFKCVCKSWKTLISDPTFVKLHLKRSERSKHQALFLIHGRHSRDFSVTLFPKRRLPPNESFKLANNPKFEMKDVHGFLYPVGSYNRLLCLFGYFSKDTLLYLWNPSTRTLSNKIPFPHKDKFQYLYLWKFAFGYDNSTDTYKIVAFHEMTYEVRVCSFGDNILRNIQSFPMVPVYRAPSFVDSPGIKRGVHVSGTLNWLAIQNEFQYEHQIDWKRITTNQFVIISLDLSTETYISSVGFDKVPPIQPTLAVLMDYLCFCHDFHETDFVIWQMKEFGVQEPWTQFIKISYQSLPMLAYHCRLFPLCLS